ncbi:hypothetical protein [Streptomyces sp. NPDC059142]|uniref:hypothetical protein n=1 Tax=Streptomyces sp. NPDC059142 TaxID=3346739 RepID=UPI00369C98C0
MRDSDWSNAMRARTVSTLVIPYITARQGEKPVPQEQLVIRGSGGRGGIQYRYENPRDRDLKRVLWARCSQKLGGAPRWSEVHPARQRECMVGLRCQVCARPADRTAAGYLFLAKARPGSSGLSAKSWEGRATAQPPLCLAHARVAVEKYPHLAPRCVVLRVAAPRLYGVTGVLYQPVPGQRQPRPVPGQDPERAQTVPYDDVRRLPWVLASQLLRTLHGVTAVNPGSGSGAV